MFKKIKITIFKMSYTKYKIPFPFVDIFYCMETKRTIQNPQSQ